jgi:hypothetical protein
VTGLRKKIIKNLFSPEVSLRVFRALYFVNPAVFTFSYILLALSCLINTFNAVENLSEIFFFFKKISVSSLLRRPSFIYRDNSRLFILGLRYKCDGRRVKSSAKRGGRKKEKKYDGSSYHSDPRAALSRGESTAEHAFHV